MNYYPFHLGDYAAHTAHLELLEDLAYRRMIDLYYIREAPLPLDAGEISRLIRMRNHVGEVECVLKEFFDHTEEGWRNRRCDAEIASMQAKQGAADDKAEHERERMRRHRERRAAMFAALRAADVIPAYDISIKELQRLHDQYCNSSETHLKREQDVFCNEHATAIPTPTPTPTPTPIKEGESAGAPHPPAEATGPEKPKKARAASVLADKPDDVTDQTWGDWQALRKAKKAPATETVLKTARAEAGKAGLSLEDFLQIWCMRGSQGLQADWLKPDELRGRTRAAAPQQFDPSRYGTGTRRI